MSQPGSRQVSGPVQKPRSNVYTVLLILSLLAIGTGIGLLWAELAGYNYEIKGPTGYHMPVEADTPARPQLATMEVRSARSRV